MVRRCSISACHPAVRSVRRSPPASQVNLDFGWHDPDDEIAAQHYAFLISEDEFGIFGRIIERRDRLRRPRPDSAAARSTTMTAAAAYFRPDGHA